MREIEAEIWELIERVLYGDPDKQDIQALEDWKSLSDENRRIFEVIQKVGFIYPEDFNEIKMNALIKVHQSITEGKNHRYIKLWKYIAVAATIALLLASTAMFLLVKEGPVSKDIFLETTVPYGQRAQLSLSDGTRVYLNSGSSIRYPVQFKGKFREVHLAGEAYFEVKKDIQREFIVFTHGLNVRVYGTHFNVKSFPEEELFEATLVEGSVGIFKDSSIQAKDIFKLVPDQRIIYNKKNGKTRFDKVEAELLTSWKDGRYYFEKEPLSSIVRALERNFNIPIEITSKELNNVRFSGLFDSRKTVYQILDIMKLSENFDIVIKNDTIRIFKPKKLKN